MAQGLKSVREAVKPLLQGSLRYTSNEVAEQICRSLKISLSATFSWVFASFVCAYPLHVRQVCPCDSCDTKNSFHINFLINYSFIHISR